jgi:hypothetical protein
MSRTLVNRAPVGVPPVAALTLDLPCEKYMTVPVPGHPKSQMGSGYVPVMSLPPELRDWMEVNPRVPNTSVTGVVSGPVPAAIRKTLWEDPEMMALMNAGIYLLVESGESYNAKGGEGRVRLRLTDPNSHGIVNGGHTFATIIDAANRATDEQLAKMKRAFVRIHIMRGLATDSVVEIAQGLNRSKQVKDTSLRNLDNQFDTFKKAMEGKHGEGEIAYYEGDKGDVDIAEVLAYLEMFNLDRYPLEEHPHNLYGRRYNAMKQFDEDVEQRPRAIQLLQKKMPEILVLTDKIRKITLEVGPEDLPGRFQIGRAKSGDGDKRVRSPENRNTPLHFLGETMNGDPPRAWLYPMLSAFRANVNWDSAAGVFTWKVPPDQLLKAVATKLVATCIQEHKNNQGKPEFVAKKSSAYELCAMHVNSYMQRLEIDQLRAQASRR